MPPSDGDTLLIGVDDHGKVLGLHHDYARVLPKNGDGLVNWLTTHLTNALGHTRVTRARARITVNNSTRAPPDGEVGAYIANRWPP